MFILSLLIFEMPAPLTFYQRPKNGPRLATNSPKEHRIQTDKHYFCFGLGFLVKHRTNIYMYMYSSIK